MRTPSRRSFSSTIHSLAPMILALAFVLSGCEKGGENPEPPRDLLAPTAMELPAASDLGADAGADLAMPPDLSAPFTPIPGTLLGVPVSVSLSCNYERRGWMRDMMGDCQRTFSMSASMQTKGIRIDSIPDGKYRLAAGQTEVFAMDYKLELGEAMPYSAWTDGGDPFVSVRKIHSYELRARSLHIETTILHDNDSPLPLPMCADYYFERTQCTGDLSW